MAIVFMHPALPHSKSTLRSSCTVVTACNTRVCFYNAVYSTQACGTRLRMHYVRAIPQQENMSRCTLNCGVIKENVWIKQLKTRFCKNGSFIWREKNNFALVKPTGCTNVSKLFYSWWHSTCFGRPFLPSSGVQDCTYSNRHMSNGYCCLLASWCPLASGQQ